MPLSTGQILENRYRIVKLLGQGGFGAVYRAWDTKLNGPCAVKESFESSAAAQKQFEREASLLFNLRHPNLPRVFDSFILPGQGLYLVMDYIEGQDLQELLEQAGGPLPEAQVLPWIGQVCAALSYLHSQTPPVVHRDLKPANIRITPQGQAMLVDFGIAKLYDPNLKTTAGARAVTPGFSPPEQYGRGSTDLRSDVYSLGATLYALLTGQAPPDSVDVLTGNQPAPHAARALNPGVSAGVSAAIEKAMRLERAERWPSVAALWQALQAGGPPAPTPPIPLRGTAGMQSPSQMQKGGTQVVGYAGADGQAGRARLPRPAQGIPWSWVAAALGLVILALGVALVPSLLGGDSTADSQATQTALAWRAETAVAAATQTTRLPATDPPKDIATAKPPTATRAEPTHTLPPTATRAEPTRTLPPTLTPTPAAPEGMVLIPAGEFQMGSKNGGGDEKPVHTVYLDAYYIDVHEVTNARYAECVAAGECTQPGSGSNYGNAAYADHPVVNVDWNQARAYCQWRGGRLPTEAEWEKAARGGLEGMDYPWGDETPICEKGAKNGAQFSGCDGDTVPVGSFAPNGYGLYDMAGNVWEWVQDWYLESFYGSSPRDNPTGPVSGEYRVVRGGGWGGSGALLSANRGWSAPSSRSGNLGFRCVATVKSPE
ncbi:MAG: bifunctional serine/threonine-protein kinase/formylglycine-generating enzyme family protein [Chloroflexota bacterium]